MRKLTIRLVRAVRGYTLFAGVTKFQEYGGELLGYLQAGKLTLAVHTWKSLGLWYVNLSRQT